MESLNPSWDAEENRDHSLLRSHQAHEWGLGLNLAEEKLRCGNQEAPRLMPALPRTRSLGLGARDRLALGLPGHLLRFLPAPTASCWGSHIAFGIWPQGSQVGS